MANGANGSSLWKYVATIAVTVMLAGSPGILYALRTWNINTEVKVIRERQDDVRTRLTIVEAQLRAEHDLVVDLQEQIRDLQARPR